MARSVAIARPDLLERLREKFTVYIDPEELDNKLYIPANYGQRIEIRMLPDKIWFEVRLPMQPVWKVYSRTTDGGYELKTATAVRRIKEAQKYIEDRAAAANELARQIKERTAQQSIIRAAWSAHMGGRVIDRTVYLDDGSTIGAVPEHNGIQLKLLPVVSIDQAQRIIDILNESLEKNHG